MPENIDLEFTSETLIKFVENNALKEIASINISSDEEDRIDFDHVRIWYFETEKLIRILANIIPSTMAQPINQLRYAGHHILKATRIEAQEDKDKGDPNLIEAYKHCKRAYYDSLDLYVFHMSDVFRSKASLLLIRDKMLEEKISNHLDGFTKLRLESDDRIKYYSKVSQTLLVGLSLISDINRKLKEAGITDELLSDKSILIKNLNTLNEENRKLKQDYNKLDLDVKASLQAADARQSRRFAYLSVFLMVVTAVSILFQGYFTADLLTPKSESLLTVKNLLDPSLIKNAGALTTTPPENKDVKEANLPVTKNNLSESAN